MSTNITAIVDRLDAARLDRMPTGQFDPPFDLDCGYAAQKESVTRRMARGERVIGLKMGFTSRTKMAQMGVADMIWGRLTDAMIVEDGGVLDTSAFIHPRTEPEIAFLLARPISGPITPLQALEAVAAVAPAIEIIDSRYKDFRFTHEEVVADNCSSAAVVVGPWRPRTIDTANLGMMLSVDGRPRHYASSAALLGHPLRSLVAASRLVARYGASGGELESGSIILAGAATAAVPVEPGRHISLEVERLGTTGFTAHGGHA
ncbi:MAG: fumarylacetoacetate hydrolase family protein [Sphingobium sp.]